MIDIIFVNWNAGNLLKEAVDSIVQYHSGLVGKVVIVDNASTDDSLARVEAIPDLPFELEVIRNIKMEVKNERTNTIFET
jgi:glycosyltransferase involved in cell wall biosynthesis